MRGKGRVRKATWWTAPAPCRAARQVWLHRDMRLGGRAALAHLIDMDRVPWVLRVGVFAHRAHVRRLQEDDVESGASRGRSARSCEAAHLVGRRDFAAAESTGWASPLPPSSSQTRSATLRGPPRESQRHRPSRSVTRRASRPAHADARPASPQGMPHRQRAGGCGCRPRAPPLRAPPPDQKGGVGARTHLRVGVERVVRAGIILTRG